MSVLNKIKTQIIDNQNINHHENYNINNRNFIGFSTWYSS